MCIHAFFGGLQIREILIAMGRPIKRIGNPRLGLPIETRNYTHPRTLVLPINNRIDFTRNYKLNTPNIVKFITDSTLSNIGRDL